jgi:hypothetical protein
LVGRSVGPLVGLYGKEEWKKKEKEDVERRREKSQDLGLRLHVLKSERGGRGTYKRTDGRTK